MVCNPEIQRHLKEISCSGSIETWLITYISGGVFLAGEESGDTAV